MHHHTQQQQHQSSRQHAMEVDQFGPSGLMMAAPNARTSGDSQLVKLTQDNSVEMLRMIQQYLNEQGYEAISKQLAEASKVPVEAAHVTEFRQQVLAGNWSDIPSLVTGLVKGHIKENNNGDSGNHDQGQTMVDTKGGFDLVARKQEFLIEEQVRIIEYLIFEQKYMELVVEGKTLEAIIVLQSELQPRAPIQERLHELAQLIILAPAQKVSQNEAIQQNSELPEVVKVEENALPDTDTGDKIQKSELRNEKEVIDGHHDSPHSVELKKHAPWWLGAGTKGRAHLLEKVQQVLQSDSMLEPHRLETLMQQALTFQLAQCRYHNMHVDKFSLAENHFCSTDVIPQNCIATLKAHRDQVWLVQFSNVAGDKLASVCKDGTMCIWSIKWLNRAGLQSVEVTCSVAIHTKIEIIQALNWTNTSDNWLVVAGKDRHALIFSASTGQSVIKLEGHASAIQSAVFAADDRRVFTIGTDQNLIMHEINLTDGTKGASSRIRTKYCVDMALKQGTLISINKTQAYCYSFKSHQNQTQGDAAEDSEMAEADYLEGSQGKGATTTDMGRLNQEEYSDVNSANVRLIDGGDTVTAIALSKDGEHLLANISMTKPRIECYHVASGEVRGKYRGHEQRNYILRPAFGGLDERLVLCGSEDSSICVWHRHSQELIARIQGHYQIVNSVTWSSTNALLFASASDDTHVKLWSVQHVEATIVAQNRQKKGGKNIAKEEKKLGDQVVSNNNSSSDSDDVANGARQLACSSSSSSSSSDDNENDLWATDHQLGQSRQNLAAAQHVDNRGEEDQDDDEDDEDDDEGWGNEMEEVD